MEPKGNFNIEIDHSAVPKPGNLSNNNSRRNVAAARVISPNSNADLQVSESPEEIVEESQPLRFLSQDNQHDAGEISVNDQKKFSKIKKYFLILSTALYIFDLGSDIYVLGDNFHQGFWRQGVISLISIISSGILVSVFSAWYLLRSDKFLNVKLSSFFRGKQILYVLSHVLFLSPVHRAIKILYFVKMGNAQQMDRVIKHEYPQFGYLRIIEAVVESAPQVILQMSVLIQMNVITWNATFVIRLLSIIVSWVTFSTGLMSHYDAVRHSSDKPTLTYLGMFIFFLWKLMVVTPRLIIMALFATVFPYWLFGVLLAHWMLMLYFIRKQKATYFSLDREAPIEWLVSILLAWIHIFDFFSVKDGDNGRKMALFYGIVMLGENSVFLFVWWFHTTGMSFCLELTLLCSLIVVWTSGIVVMIIFYINSDALKIKENPAANDSSSREVTDNNHISSPPMFADV